MYLGGPAYHFSQGLASPTILDFTPWLKRPVSFGPTFYTVQALRSRRYFLQLFRLSFATTEPYFEMVFQNGPRLRSTMVPTPPRCPPPKDPSSEKTPLLFGAQPATAFFATYLILRLAGFPTRIR